MTSVMRRPGTAQPGQAGRPRPAVPRRPRGLQRSDYATLAGSLASGTALMWLVCYRLVPVGSSAAFFILAYIASLTIYGIVTTQLLGRLIATDRIVGVVIATLGALLLAALTMIIGFVVVKGAKSLSLSFLTETLASVGPEDAGGGVGHAIVGTLEQVAIAIVIAVPLGIATAVYLNEVGGRLARPVRFVIDAMSGVPSIVAGLFIYAIWLNRLGNSFSGFGAALALAILMLPSVTRASEEVLRLVPGGLRESSLALGATDWRTTWHVVLPTAMSGIITAVILGVARAVGETAPLIMTSFGSSVMNWNPFKDPQSSLPLFVYAQVRQSKQVQIDRAWGAALVLIVLVLALFTLARFVGRRALVGGTGGRQRKTKKRKVPA